MPKDNRASSHDLERVKIPVAQDDSLPELVALTHPWSYRKQVHVCAGHITLQELTGERKVAFSFGGDLFVKTCNDKTFFTLKSTAPILRLEGYNQTPMILADEVSILLAGIRAGKLSKLDEYGRNLSCADPLILYCACLNALHSKFEGVSFHESPILFTFHNEIVEEIEALQEENKWPGYLQALEDIL